MGANCPEGCHCYSSSWRREPDDSSSRRWVSGRWYLHAEAGARNMSNAMPALHPQDRLSTTALPTYSPRSRTLTIPRQTWSSMFTDISMPITVARTPNAWPTTSTILLHRWPNGSEMRRDRPSWQRLAAEIPSRVRSICVNNYRALSQFTLPSQFRSSKTVANDHLVTIPMSTLDGLAGPQEASATPMSLCWPQPTRMVLGKTLNSWLPAFLELMNR